MHKRLLSSLIIAGLLPLSGTSLGAPQADEIYQRHCAGCHGEQGDGQGGAAKMLYPKPRDFTLGVYKFRSTPSGSPPTDDDILATLKNGIPGTSMPPWNRLSDEQLKGLVNYIKKFSDIFEDKDIVEAPIKVAKAPKSSSGSVKAGHKVYLDMECDKCHGPSGKGDGPSAHKLTDDQDRPIRPYDFTRGPGLMKGGISPTAIYRTFMTGLDGTPMPSYADDLNEQQRWQLVHYIQSLSAANTSASSLVPSASGTPTLQVTQVASDPSLKPSDAQWQNIPAVVVALRPTWARDNWVEAVKVQIAQGPKMLTFRFEWEDENPNNQIEQTQDFRDGIALEYSANGMPSEYIGIPFIGMGNDDKAVSIWHWKADRQARLAAKSDTKLKYASAVEALEAKGFGTLEPLKQQDITGHGEWSEGRWAVVMQQPIDAANGLLKNKTLPIAIAAWDGSAKDRGGRKSVSEWLELKVETEASKVSMLKN